MDSLLFLHSLQSSSMFLFLLPLLLACIIFWLHCRQKLPHPPGPRGCPIIRNMGNMLGVVSFKWVGLHVIAVSTPDMAQEVLQVQDSVFCKRQANVAITHLTYNRADMAFTNYGPFWRQMTKICVVKLFGRKGAESWASVREEVDSMVRAVKEKTVHQAAFGSFSHEGQDEFMKILQEFSKLFGAFNIAVFFPWLGWILAQDFNKRLARAYMVDELMGFYSQDDEKNGFHDSQSTMKLTIDNVKAVIMLMKSPEELKKVQQELTDVIGLNRVGNESDLQNLTYLKCVLKETLCLHQPIPLLLHETAEDSVVAGMQPGLYALKMSVAHLLHCFKWEFPDGMKASELDMNGVFGLTASRATRLVAVPTYRLNCPFEVKEIMDVNRDILMYHMWTNDDREYICNRV
ncbi:hypothetical protein P3X46_033634 [Hevea brasiliensis]|uniref:Uncharacterized protein n=1 Tax=Hevea brasiliensis TaxID=3981 RepID=A0ABQ9KDB5_HEVBR|nr:hypothetical protein P3X46_033634 [Hevea brasiliensis]